MPKEWTHIYLADAVRKRLPDDALHRTLDKFGAYYLAGGVVPDIPYYSWGKTRRLLKALGDSLHDSPDPLFAGIQELSFIEPVPEIEPLIAFMAGIFTHAYADIVFHPFIYYFSGLEDYIRHRQLEARLDLAYARKDEGILSGELHSLFTTSQHDLIRVREWTEVFYSPYGKESGIGLSNSFRLQRMWRARFRNPWWQILSGMLASIPFRIFRENGALFYPRSVHAGVDFSRPFSYRHPVTGETISRSLQSFEDEMIERMQEPLALLRSLMDGTISFSGQDFSLQVENMSSGLAGKTRRDMQFFDLSMPVDRVFPKKNHR